MNVRGSTTSNKMNGALGKNRTWVRSTASWALWCVLLEPDNNRQHETIYSLYILTFKHKITRLRCRSSTLTKGTVIRYND